MAEKCRNAQNVFAGELSVALLLRSSGDRKLGAHDGQLNTYRSSNDLPILREGLFTQIRGSFGLLSGDVVSVVNFSPPPGARPNVPLGGLVFCGPAASA